MSNVNGSQETAKKPADSTATQDRHGNPIEPGGREEHREPSGLAPVPLGHLALRDDGKVLLSLEDAGDRDLSAREVVSFIVLTEQETAFAQEKMLESTLFVASCVASKLPKRSDAP